jgi:hypothetical protein
METADHTALEYIHSLREAREEKRGKKREKLRNVRLCNVEDGRKSP